MNKLPAIPDDDRDFTPELARKIIVKYQEYIAAYEAETGWRLVPIEPTEAMRQACHDVEPLLSGPEELWRAFLEAAPSPEQETQP
jgi:hypothetical protein